MSYQPLYATLSDNHGTVHTHSLRGRQDVINGWVNTNIGELLRFHIHHNDVRPNRKGVLEEPIIVTAYIVFPDCVQLKMQGKTIEAQLDTPAELVVLKRLKGE